jgi:outer membrane lipoprotein-sorting protein
MVADFMFKTHHSWTRLLLAGALLVAFSPRALARKGKHPTGLSEILMHMSGASKTLKTVSAHLDYTSVTVLVDDKSTQTGEIFFRKGKTPDILIDFQKPERKLLLLKNNLGEMYLPKINQIQEYDVGQKSQLVQQFLLLGFGSDIGELKKSYDIKYLPDEADLDGETTVQFELVPRKKGVAAQLTKIQLWISEDSWLPVQQEFFQVGGNYLIAHYSGVKVNRSLPNSVFEIKAPSNVKRVKMN